MQSDIVKTSKTGTPSVLQRKCECGRCSACNDHTANTYKRAPGNSASRSIDELRSSHDFANVRISSNKSSTAISDQTQSGGLSEEFTKGTAAPGAAETPTNDLNLGGEEAKPNTTAPVIDQVEVVSSSAGAVKGYAEKLDTCDASLNKPGPFNDMAFRGSVANVHQVQFHVSQGNPSDLRATRIVNRTAAGRGQTFSKSGNDGPPDHEYSFTKDKMVVADAPGWCSKLTETDFPVNYSGDFALYAWDAPTKQILASIAYHVEVKKTHFSQGDPVNTVSVTEKKIGGTVPSR